ncbi:hypothetical protein [Burkholderia ubonensis]|uniref:Uncharacterized protein n=1 Tax=Burkholderia ubonensis subsp. mesacidophila TaxID=265293 RepID=A0A2A4FAW1_9BURK|nr:hypothetical protein [Burkholderia ubonensis]PCE30157.1 hypothetical protein BZL54_22155 [Burkholderia ubonensis subsp. mesacidophila]
MWISVVQQCMGARDNRRRASRTEIAQADAMLPVNGKLASKHQHSFLSSALKADQRTSGRIVQLPRYAPMDVVLPIDAA